MAYIEQSLTGNEKLLYKARFPWFHHAEAWAVLVLSAVAAVVMLGNERPAWLAALIAVAGLAVFLTIMIPIWTTEIGVTDHRLIVKRGLLTRSTEELELRAIEQVSLDQGLLGHLFGFGKIVVHGTGDATLRIPVIADPVSLRRAIQEAAVETRQPASPPR